jgi:AAA domain
MDDNVRPALFYSRQLADDWAASPQIDKLMAERHAELIAGKGKSVYLRFVHDARAPGAYSVEHKGTICDLWGVIVAAQARGYGIFLIVNEGDSEPGGGMMRDRDIKRARALFTDRDGPPKPDVSYHLPPSFVNERNANKQHSYWLLDPNEQVTASQSRAAQRQLALHYATDLAISNPSRIMRLAGSLNMKDPANPEMYKLRETPGGAKVYTLAQVLAGLPELRASKPSSNLGSNDPRKLHPETLEKIFAHFDPTLSGEKGRGSWIGAIRLVAERGIALMREMPEDWWLDLAVDWSDGTLRRKHVDPNFKTPATFIDGHTEAEIAYEFSKPGSDRDAGDKFNCGSLIWHARKAGYNGSTDDNAFTQAEKNIDAKAYVVSDNNRSNLNNSLDTKAESMKAFEYIRDRETQLATPDPEMLVEEICPHKKLILPWGATGDGKTYWGVEIATAVAMGRPAFGKFKTLKEGIAVIFAGEDCDRIEKTRLTAIERHYGKSLQGLVYTVDAAFPINDPKLCEKYCEELDRLRRQSGKEIAVVLNDTLKRSLGTLKPNDGDTGQKFTAAMEALIKAFNTTVICNAHQPKSGPEGGISGTGSFVDNAPITPHLTRHDGGGQFIIRCDFEPKFRVGPRPEPFSVKGVPVALPHPVAGVVSDLVFVAMTPDEQRKDSALRVERDEFRRVLDAVGAHDLAHGLTTRQFAEQLAPDRTTFKSNDDWRQEVGRIAARLDNGNRARKKGTRVRYAGWFGRDYRTNPKGEVKWFVPRLL